MSDNEIRLIDANELIKNYLNHCLTEFESKNKCMADENVIAIIDNAPTVEITETEIQKVLNKRCMTAVTNEYLIALHTTYHEAYKKGLDDGKAIMIKEIKERLEERYKHDQQNDTGRS